MAPSSAAASAEASSSLRFLASSFHGKMPVTSWLAGWLAGWRGGILGDVLPLPMGGRPFLLLLLLLLLLRGPGATDSRGAPSLPPSFRLSPSVSLSVEPRKGKGRVWGQRWPSALPPPPPGRREGGREGGRGLPGDGRGLPAPSEAPPRGVSRRHGDGGRGRGVVRARALPPGPLPPPPPPPLVPCCCPSEEGEREREEGAMMAASSSSSSWLWSFLLVSASGLSFRALNGAVERLCPPPPPAQRNRWKWRNIWTSLAHSLLSGASALLGFWLQPQMAQDLIESHPAASHRLLGISIGYFLQDFLDMANNQKLHQCWELLFHHSVVIVCFGFAFLAHRFVGFAMVALLVEINSVFLHLRTILLMAGRAQTTFYRLTSLVNLGTYVVFRITTLAWMTRWLVLNRESIPAGTYALSTVGMAIMIPMNIVLFYRLLRNDFLTSSRCEKEK